MLGLERTRKLWKWSYERCKISGTTASALQLHRNSYRKRCSSFICSNKDYFIRNNDNKNKIFFSNFSAFLLPKNI